MAKKPKILPHKIKEAITKADNTVRNDPVSLFGSDSQRKQKLFTHLKQSAKIWDRPGHCMYRGCSKPSIRHSHSIHRASSLQLIAEDQHVLTPALNNNGELCMTRVGLNIASTFPGFCELHEQLFSEFESSGSISSPSDLVLQAFRTLCREIVRKRKTITDFESLLGKYEKARLDHYISAIKEVLPEAIVNNISISGDGMEQSILVQLTKARESLLGLEGELYDEFFNLIETKSEEPALHAVSLPYKVPVSLSGFTSLPYEVKGNRSTAICLFGILPQADSTICFIASTKEHSSLIKDFGNAMLEGFGSVNFMEAWMVNGSDHWFIRPSSWAAIPPIRQANILEMLMSDEFHIGQFPPFSILDEVRNEIINYINSHIDEGKDKEMILQMVEHESKKLYS